LKYSVEELRKTKKNYSQDNRSLSHAGALTTGPSDFFNAIILETLNLQQCIHEFNAIIAGTRLVVRDILNTG
jgi:hypothetical protein